MRSAKKAGKIKKRIFVLICVAVLVAAGVAFASQAVKISGKKAEYEDLVGQEEEVSRDNDDLERVMNDGSEAERIERIARENDDYVYPDERVYIDVTPGK